MNIIPAIDWIRVNLRETSPTQRALKRFMELSLEMEHHCRGQHFGDAMLTFPSAKFHEWCELSKLLDSKEAGMPEAKPLPRYRCHKIVEALKIKEVVWALDHTLLITPEEDAYPPFTVEAKFVPSHDAARPAVGWYWVKYADGYQSFSPASVFEEGYTRI